MKPKPLPKRRIPRLAALRVKRRIVDRQLFMTKFLLCKRRA